MMERIKVEKEVAVRRPNARSLSVMRLRAGD
jgi:hypothetical protein